jgi:hypothetical protein
MAADRIEVERTIGQIGHVYGALRSTLGILHRTVKRGYPGPGASR